MADKLHRLRVDFDNSIAPFLYNTTGVWTFSTPIAANFPDESGTRYVVFLPCVLMLSSGKVPVITPTAGGSPLQRTETTPNPGEYRTIPAGSYDSFLLKDAIELNAADCPSTPVSYTITNLWTIGSVVNPDFLTASVYGTGKDGTVTLDGTGLGNSTNPMLDSTTKGGEYNYQNLTITGPIYCGSVDTNIAPVVIRVKGTLTVQSGGSFIGTERGAAGGLGGAGASAVGGGPAGGNGGNGARSGRPIHIYAKNIVINTTSKWLITRAGKGQNGSSGEAVNTLYNVTNNEVFGLINSYAYCNGGPGGGGGASSSEIKVVTATHRSVFEHLIDKQMSDLAGYGGRLISGYYEGVPIYMSYGGQAGELEGVFDSDQNLNSLIIVPDGYIDNFGIPKRLKGTPGKGRPSAYAYPTLTENVTGSKITVVKAFHNSDIASDVGLLRGGGGGSYGCGGGGGGSVSFYEADQGSDYVFSSGSDGSEPAVSHLGLGTITIIDLYDV